MSTRMGYVYGFSAYLFWGAFPLFFWLLNPVDPFEIVPWRVLTALVYCAIMVALARTWGPLVSILRSPRMLGWFTLSSLLLYANWQIFIIGILSGHIIEAALGYFINPLFTILIGVVVRKERLSVLQWIAVGIAAIGVVISAIAYGQFPFIALGLALTFGLYGAVRKQVSQEVDALTGLTIETLIGSLVAVAQLAVVFAIAGSLSAFDHGPGVTIPLILSGLVTAVPLLLFGAGNRRLPLSHMGFIQFLTPVLGFLTGYFVFHEDMPFARWVGFIAVWIALVVLVTDMMLTVRRGRREAATAESVHTAEIVVQPAS